MCPCRQGRSNVPGWQKSVRCGGPVGSWWIWICAFHVGNYYEQNIKYSWHATETLFSNHILTENRKLRAYNFLQTLPQGLRKSTLNFISLLSLNLAMPSKEAKFHHEQIWGEHCLQGSIPQSLMTLGIMQETCTLQNMNCEHHRL